MKHDIFISYRRKGGYETAKHLSDLLARDRYSVSFDIDTLRSGDFDTALLKIVDECTDFILIVEEHTFDNCIDPKFDIKKDWVRCELAHALKLNKNIIPVFITENVEFPENLPEDISDVSKKNGLIRNMFYFEAFYEKLCNSFLKSKPVRDKSIAEVIKEAVNFLWNYHIFRVLLPLGVLCLSVFIGYLIYLHVAPNIKNINDFQYDTKHLNEEQIRAVNQILDNMKFVEGGTFFMGNPERADYPDYRVEEDKYSDIRHEVKLDNYYISRLELTQFQYKAFISPEGKVKDIDLDKPMDYLSWNQCKEFVDTIRALTGIDFDLPTEAQWEYAARGGRQGVNRELLFSGSDDCLIAGWVLSENSTVQVHGIKDLKQPNELGLYNMTGNVDEWCKDSFSPYKAKSQRNPISTIGNTKVIRGGSVISDRNHAKVYMRASWYPMYQRTYTGCRLVINKKIK